MSSGLNAGPVSDDEVVLTLVGIGAVALLVAKWTAVMEAVSGWLIDHNVLVTEAVALTVPATGGAGLDAPRLAIAVAGVLLLVVLALAHRSRLRRQGQPAE